MVTVCKFVNIFLCAISQYCWNTTSSTRSSISSRQHWGRAIAPKRTTLWTVA